VQAWHRAHRPKPLGYELLGARAEVSLLDLLRANGHLSP
jgi:hypothetical protein